jgi:ribonuclease PH
MTDAGEFIEIQSTAERGTFSRNSFDDILDLAYKGIGELLQLQKQVINEIV